MHIVDAREVPAQRSDQPVRPHFDRVAADSGDGPTSTGKSGPSMAQRVQEELEKNWTFYRSREGRVYGEHHDHRGRALAHGKPSEVMRRVGLTVRATAGKYPDSKSAAEGSAAIEYMAEGVRDVHLRSAPVSGGFVVDLALDDDSVVLITADGWSATTTMPPGVSMRRSALSAAMADPRGAPAGGLDLLRSLVNLSDEDGPLLLALLLSVWMPGMACPIVYVTGPQDTGKTTFARFGLSLVDPVTVERGGNLPASEVEWKARLSPYRAVLIDNASGITAAQSDTLCKISTGGEAAARALYSDDTAHVTHLQAPVWFTSIGVGALRSDLASRMVRLELHPLPPEQRMALSDLHTAQDAARPAIVRGLLDLAVQVLAAMPTVDRSALRHRNGDFEVLLRAVDTVLDTRGAHRLVDQANDLALDVLDADPVAQVLIAAVEAEREDRRPTSQKDYQETTLVGTWTAGELLRRLTAYADAHGHHRGDRWPRTPTVMVQHLQRIAPDLRRVGIKLSGKPSPTGGVAEPRRSGGRKVYDLLDTTRTES